MVSGVFALLGAVGKNVVFNQKSPVIRHQALLHQFHIPAMHVQQQFGQRWLQVIVVAIVAVIVRQTGEQFGHRFVK